MRYTEQTLLAEHMAFLNAEDRGDVLAWLTAPTTGTIEKEWDDE